MFFQNSKPYTYLHLIPIQLYILLHLQDNTLTVVNQIHLCLHAFFISELTQTLIFGQFTIFHMLCDNAKYVLHCGYSVLEQAI